MSKAQVFLAFAFHGNLAALARVERRGKTSARPLGLAALGILALITLSGCATTLVREPYAPATSRLATQGNVKTAIDQLAVPLIASGRNIGMVVGFATPEEEGVYAYGSKDLEHQVPMTPDAVFQTGSISKSFLAVLVAELARQGKFQLDDPVGPFLPKNMQLASPDLGKVTFRELASHTSGMKHEAYTAELLEGVITYLVNGKNLYRFLSDAAMTEYLEELDFTRPEEKAYAYSNIGFTYLGWVIDHMGPEGLQQLLQDDVFKPLGLKHTGLGLTTAPPPHLTPGYAGDLPTFVARDTPVEPWLFEEGIAGPGAVYSTAADLLRYAKINAGLTPSPLTPALDVTRLEVASAEGGKIAMSWFLKRLPDSGEPYTYIAGIVGGHTSFVGFDPTRHLAVVVLQNSINHDDLVGVELLDRLVGAYRSKHDGIKPKAAPPPKPDAMPLVSRKFEMSHYSSK